MVCNALEHGLKGDGKANDQPALAALVDELGRECARDGRRACFDGSPGPYTIRGNRLSNNSRHGYWHWRMKDGEDTQREIALDANDVFGNGGDGIRNREAWSSP